jgi:hypothetical protein
MSNVKHYCITEKECVNVVKKKASIGCRGFFRLSWRQTNRIGKDDPILTLHAKACNTFMECYV